MTVSDQRAPARKRGRPTAAERVQRRTQILDAALAIFLEHGFGNTTIEQLAQAARVSKRTIYSYFGDKAAVFTEMVQRLAKGVSTEPPPGDTLETLAIRIVTRLHSAELIGLHQLVIAESSRFPELAITLHSNGDQRHISRLAEHLRTERGPEAEKLAPVLFTLLLGLPHRMRLLGLLDPVTNAQAEDQALTALDALGLRD
ncbi:TetR/AcrR family transcriptional regulator [Paramicrobacterium agarici]|uniref:TetR family transcriptional regulator n=1 Tax=Paramicrobacterium agarici TaxID=630514 RepID=A0A2A9DYQ8_9MICO|nr:TetR/AcrR family transcriptional regulator [Microbacterium agarici]PFG31112.1 TetR family transcriptional regulator [Microbacterium agarici]TQO24183.1 TetR family transcriptional regulator [Microbacterium agarici]